MSTQGGSVNPQRNQSEGQRNNTDFLAQTTEQKQADLESKLRKYREKGFFDCRIPDYIVPRFQNQK